MAPFSALQCQCTKQSTPDLAKWQETRHPAAMRAHKYHPPADGPDILFSDAALIVIDKPSGLLSVPGRGEEKADSAISRVQRIFQDALTVHRLDMDTSGLLVMARGADAHRTLSKQFARGEVSKTYIADVWGTPSPSEGLIDLPLIADWPNRPRQKVDDTIGKPSQTRYRIIRSHRHGARVELTPLTGRSHQLRVHLASIGHAILGDEFYAAPAAFAASDRLRLHASKLRFTHPSSNEPVSIESPCPFHVSA